VSAIAAYALQVGDRAIVAAVAGLDELGVYGVGARCASIITVVLVGFRGAALPALYEVAARSDGAAQIGRALRLYAAVCLVLVALLWLASEPLVALLAPPQFARAAQLVGPLALGAALSSAHLFSPGLLLAGRTRLVAQVQFAAVAVYFLLCWQLTRLYGGPGAAAAYVLTMAGQQAVLWRLARRHFPAPQSPRIAS
jgi:O-antigen/teichoic acid export membrane protein